MCLCHQAAGGFERFTAHCRHDAQGALPVEHLTIQDFKDKIFDFEQNKDWSFRGAIPVLIDFYADWCGPCKALAPVLDDLSKEYAGRIQIYKVDTEAEQELAAMFGIRSIPSLLFIPMEGQPTMAQGALPKATLKQAFKDILNVS
jgi:thioredoxin 1